MNTPTHTLNPNTGRKIAINGVRFWILLKYGFKYDEELNLLFDKPLPPDIPKCVSNPRMVSPNNCSNINGGTAFNELIRGNYRCVKGRWVKMTKEEAEAYDNDPNIGMMFADDDDSSSESEYVNIDEFEYDKDGHVIFPF